MHLHIESIKKKKERKKNKVLKRTSVISQEVTDRIRFQIGKTEEEKPQT